jgi:hypothetical protein
MTHKLLLYIGKCLTLHGHAQVISNQLSSQTMYYLNIAFLNLICHKEILDVQQSVSPQHLFLCLHNISFSLLDKNSGGGIGVWKAHQKILCDSQMGEQGQEACAN